MSLVLIALSKWLPIWGATDNTVFVFGYLGTCAGVIGAGTALFCLSTVKIQSYRILVCQVVNSIWLGYVIFCLIHLGPFHMQQ